MKELEHQRNKEVELKFLRSSNSLNTQQPLIPEAAEAVVNEKKRKGDARNASIVGEQESKRLKKTAAASLGCEEFGKVKSIVKGCCRCRCRCYTQGAAYSQVTGS